MKKEIILQWLKKAEEDIKVTKHLLEDEEVLTGAICFHSQQAVEKYLKAFLTHFDIRVKKTHDIGTIFELCLKQDADFDKLNKEEISGLTFYAVEVRYPDDFYIPSVNEAKKCFETALNVKHFVFKKLKVKDKDLKNNQKK